MAAKSQTEKYLLALERLKTRGEPINNDSVAKEAGSGKGSIKKSRAGHADLIQAIADAAAKRHETDASADPVPQLKTRLSFLQRRLDGALEREICLLNELYDLREENLQLKQGRLAIVLKKR